MTDKMPDEIYACSYEYADFNCFEDVWFKTPDAPYDGLPELVRYISEQKHAEEIAALEAKHSDDLNKIIELIKQRISDE